MSVTSAVDLSTSVTVSLPGADLIISVTSAVSIADTVAVVPAYDILTATAIQVVATPTVNPLLIIIAL
ncbi:MAG: hypothetical protein GTO41_10640, partial [Burkholderiales bacterium]|nr:hypothetical protein [Burkholderiales bacterium]